MELPSSLVTLLTNFRTLFSKPVWKKATTLICGAILAPRQRTVAAALRVMGYAQDELFGRFHRVLNRNKWSAFRGANLLLRLIIKKGIGGVSERLIFVFDDTVERRQGKKIKAKGCYRDAVKSSEACVVKCFGIKWVCTSVLVRCPWSSRAWALPFLTVLAYSKKASEAKGKKHKTTVDYSRQIIIVLTRWLKALGWQGAVIFLGDGGYACVELMRMCVKCNATLVCRFRLDAVLHDFPGTAPKSKRGRKSKKGKRQASLANRSLDPKNVWAKTEVSWYGGQRKPVEYFSGKSLWYRAGVNPVPIHWVVIRIPETGRFESICSTDLNMTAVEIIELFVLRWNIEVLFEETRRHIGVETQRQWSDLAIERTTPSLMGVFSLACLYGCDLYAGGKIKKQQTAWYEKKEITFSDVLSAVRSEILREKYRKKNFVNSYVNPYITQNDDQIIDALIQELASAA